MKTGLIKIQTEKPPVVELDSQAHAAYIRFSTEPVFETKDVTTEGAIVTVDMDASGKTIKVELIGVTSFSIHDLMEKAGFPQLSKCLQEQTRYFPAGLEYA